jgi:predicted DNA-binding transcriptional regulator AlpA
MSQTALAAHFGVSDTTIWRWRRDIPDFPPGIVIANRYYWSLDAIERWKAKRANSKPPQPKSQGVRADPARAQATRERKSAEIRAAERELLAAQERLEAVRQKGARRRKPAAVRLVPADAAEVA